MLYLRHGATYPSVEHAFQAAKSRDPDYRERVRRATSPGAAKHFGKRVSREGGLRPDWDEIRVEVMRGLVRQKFTRYPVLRARLLATGERELVEVNYWHDRFWGENPVGTGENWLGRILMEIRKELRQ